MTAFGGVLGLPPVYDQPVVEHEGGFAESTQSVEALPRRNDGGLYTDQLASTCTLAPSLSVTWTDIA